MDQREVIVLKIWHDCTFEEIGELLEISPNTAAGRYRYGLQKLKFRLEREAYERDDQLRTIAFLASAPPSAGLKQGFSGGEACGAGDDGVTGTVRRRRWRARCCDDGVPFEQSGGAGGRPAGGRTRISS